MIFFSPAQPSGNSNTPAAPAPTMRLGTYGVFNGQHASVNPPLVNAPPGGKGNPPANGDTPAEPAAAQDEGGDEPKRQNENGKIAAQEKPGVVKKTQESPPKGQAAAAARKRGVVEVVGRPETTAQAHEGESVGEAAWRLATVLDPVWAEQECDDESLPELVDTGPGRVEDIPKLVEMVRRRFWDVDVEM